MRAAGAGARSRPRRSQATGDRCVPSAPRSWLRLRTCWRRRPRRRRTTKVPSREPRRRCQGTGIYPCESDLSPSSWPLASCSPCTLAPMTTPGTAALERPEAVAQGRCGEHRSRRRRKRRRRKRSASGGFGQRGPLDWQRRRGRHERRRTRQCGQRRWQWRGRTGGRPVSAAAARRHRSEGLDRFSFFVTSLAGLRRLSG